jgi:hypothetical protein
MEVGGGENDDAATTSTEHSRHNKSTNKNKNTARHLTTVRLQSGGGSTKKGDIPDKKVTDIGSRTCQF